MKYIASNIFFKFSLDTQPEESVSNTNWMYGVTSPNDDAAMKAAANDMLGLQSYYNSNVSGLHYPLMSIIDYRGFRLLAMTILPIKPKTTLLYGSRDAGHTVNNKNPILARKMEQVAKQLGLKGHFVKGANQIRKLIYGPLDIEAHLGLDNKFYVLDFGRVFPPEVRDKPSREVFWKLFRPEFVRSYGTPLSSDAFSGFGNIDRAIHNTEVKQAAKYLHEILIPKYLQEKLIPALSSGKNDLNEFSITASLHREGINCRNLGRIRNLTPIHLTSVRMQLLSEIVARTITFLVRQLLRDAMQRKKIAAKQEPYKFVVYRILQSIFSPINHISSSSSSSGSNYGSSSNISDPSLSHSNGQMSWSVDPLQLANDLANKQSIHSVEDFHEDKLFWNYKIKLIIQQRFSEALLIEELTSGDDIRRFIDLSQMVRRLCQQAGIVLRAKVLQEYESNKKNFKLLKYDLHKLRVRVRHLNVIDEAEGNLLFQEAKTQHTSRTGIWDSIHEKFTNAIASNSTSYKTYTRWGKIIVKQCLLTPMDLPNYRELVDKLLKNAIEKFRIAEQLNKEDFLPNYEKGKANVLLGIIAQLCYSTDNIASSQWYLNVASQEFFWAFKKYPDSFQMLLNEAEKVFQSALKNDSIQKEFQLFLLLESFYLLFCSFKSAPVTPSSSDYFRAGTYLFEYLKLDGKNEGNISLFFSFLFSLSFFSFSLSLYSLYFPSLFPFPFPLSLFFLLSLPLLPSLFIFPLSFPVSLYSFPLLPSLFIFPLSHFFSPLFLSSLYSLLSFLFHFSLLFPFPLLFYFSYLLLLSLSLFLLISSPSCPFQFHFLFYLPFPFLLLGIMEQLETTLIHNNIFIVLML